jgi:hypothetical protein
VRRRAFIRALTGVLSSVVLGVDLVIRMPAARQIELQALPPEVASVGVKDACMKFWVDTLNDLCGVVPPKWPRDQHET